jgi:hypothetical protein
MAQSGSEERTLIMKEIILGASYKDLITEFSGIATGRVQYISGCDQALIQPVCKDRDFIEARWFDVQRLVRTNAHNDPIKLDNEANGFDVAAPIR